MNFKEFNFEKRIMAQIDAVGYKEATPIQSKANPLIIEGNDVLG